MQKSVRTIKVKAKGDSSDRRRHLGNHARFGLLHFVLIVAGITALVPFIWMLSTSLKGQMEVLSATPTFWPEAWRWQNYKEVFEQVPFGRFYLNTAIVTVARVIGQVFFAALAAFAFARLKFPGRNLLFFGVLAVMMVLGQVTLVPNYVLLKYLGWLDSYQGLIVPSLFSAFGTFLLRQFYLSLPQNLIDAAILEGCNPLQVFWHVALPLSRSIMVAFGVLVTLLVVERLFVAAHHHQLDRHADALGRYRLLSGAVRQQLCGDDGGGDTRDLTDGHCIYLRPAVFNRRHYHERDEAVRGLEMNQPASRKNARNLIP